MARNKTVVIGLDGACWDLVDPWISDGQLPCLSSLVERGATATLSSCVPATTPPAWTTLTTGVGPGKHGVFGFYDYNRENDRVTPVSDSNVCERRLWDYLTKADMQSLVVNVPVTHPPREVDGALVPGYLSPDPPDVHPDDLFENLCMDKYSIYSPSEADDVNVRQLLEEWVHLTQTRFDLATRLIDEFEWSLLFLQLQKTDGAVHKFSNEERILEIYRKVDDCLRTLFATIDDPVNVFVVSDHGIGQPKQWGVSLNTWLASEGYAETTVNKSGSASWLEQAIVSDRENSSNKSTMTSISKAVTDALSQAGVTRRRLERMLSKMGLYEVAGRIVPDRVKSAVGSERVDRDASDAFYIGMGFSGVDTGVFVNNNRFATFESYEKFRSKLIERLASLHGPDGPVFSTVERREDVYDGDEVSGAPDIILTHTAPYVIDGESLRGRVFVPADDHRIDHTRDGLFIAAGPDISADEPPQSASIADITPTLLHLFDVPLNERFDGRVLDEVLQTDRDVVTDEYRPFDFSQRDGSDSRINEQMEQRLRQLGYLE